MRTSAQKAQDESTFGSKEWNKRFHGRNNSAKRGRGGLNRAEREKRKRAKLKADEADYMAEKKAEWEREGEELAKAHKKEEQAIERILKGNAVKLAKPNGGFFTHDEVQFFMDHGWIVSAAGTAPAKAGSALPAIADVELNPADAMTRILGQQLAARAIVLSTDGPMSRETIFEWRRAGYDVSPASVKRSVKANPADDIDFALREMKRVLKDHTFAFKAIPNKTLGFVSIYWGDEAKGLCHIITRRMSNDGMSREEAESLCLRLVPLIANHPAKEGKRGNWIVEDDGLRAILARTRNHHEETWLLSGYEPKAGTSLKGKPRKDATQVERLELSPRPGSGKNKRTTKKNASNENLHDKPGQTAPTLATRKKETGEAGGMVKSTLSPKTLQAAPAASASHHAAEWAGLEKAWERWTGSKAGASIRLKVENRGDCPAAVVMLGRLVHFIDTKGKLVDFGQQGPFLVSDARMERAWLVDRQERSFDVDLTKGLIVYLAKKPKFGDKQPVQYVHLFSGKAKARMQGNAGELTGAFRLTPRGIEG